MEISQMTHQGIEALPRLLAEMERNVPMLAFGPAAMP
jgi:hypothetical protein